MDLRIIDMKLVLIVLFLPALIGCKERLAEEVEFFGDYDLSSGNYKLLVYGAEGAWIEDYKDFYIDDTETLQEMQTHWVFRYKIPAMACGYGYILKFVNEKSILNQKSVNVDCEYMSGWIYFPKSYLSDYKSSFKRMTKSEKRQFSERYERN